MAGTRRTPCDVARGAFSGLIILGVLVTLIPGLPDHLVQVLLILQDVNAAMSPILLAFIVLLVNNRRLMGYRVNGPVRNVIAWATVVVIAVLVLVLLVSSIFHIAL